MLRPVGFTLFVWIQLLPALLFRSCVENTPLEQAQKAPDSVSRVFDRVWRKLGVRLHSEVKAERETLYAHLLKVKTSLGAEADLPQESEADADLRGVYGLLPEVYVDPPNTALFPQPLSQPTRWSWFHAVLTGQETLRLLKRMRSEASESHDHLANRLAQFNSLALKWGTLNSLFLGLTQEIRYLETWVDPLDAYHQQEISQGRTPINENIILLLLQNRSQQIPMERALLESLKPTRVIERNYPPHNLKELRPGTIILPIATDITHKRFLLEMEGALDTHWNQSSWAKTRKVRFEILWTPIPINKTFAEKKETLEQHLLHFPKNQASLTTGGLTTFVRNRPAPVLALVLGPGKTHPRTLAHELGHLLGFGDCYMRTLTGLGIFGFGVLEWENPIYPDDIMCDNTFGEPRDEVW